MGRVALTVAVVHKQVEKVQRRLIGPPEPVREPTERVIDMSPDQPPVRLCGRVDERGEDEAAAGEDFLRAMSAQSPRERTHEPGLLVALCGHAGAEGELATVRARLEREVAERSLLEQQPARDLLDLASSAATLASPDAPRRPIAPVLAMPFERRRAREVARGRGRSS